ncbi:MAG: dihydropteroate synthase [Betaproteobacteria bacterium]|nr:dihydropteroate synthase [Gammaproteobacteria bacterium]MDH3438373.1 dihydropteroate synthase [Betaproteobacteria bacterium]
MGILNVTPDSFSDGGRFVAPTLALEQARRMRLEGADVIDVGGESTRPGASSVSAEEELQRVIPVIEAISAELPVKISVDTSKPAVMREAVSAGASMINDVRALREEGALHAAANLGVDVCLMHMRGEPRTMQANPRYKDVVSEVRDFLVERGSACERHGISRSKIYIDPGFGFGKTLEHNLELLANLGAFAATNYAVMVGLSRKSMIGVLLDRSVEERVHGSVALALMAYLNGARLIRVHDVGATLDALRIAQRVRQSGRNHFLGAR